MDCAPSHLETDCRVTASFSASSSCDQPAFFLKSMILSASIILHALLYSGRHLLSVPVPLSYHSAQLRTTNSTIKSVNRRLRTFGFLVPLTHFAEPNPCPAYSSAKNLGPVLGKFLQTAFCVPLTLSAGLSPCPAYSSAKKPSPVLGRLFQAPFSSYHPFAKNPGPLSANFCKPQASGRSGRSPLRRLCRQACGSPRSSPGFCPPPKRRRASLFGQPCVFASWVIYLFIA